MLKAIFAITCRIISLSFAGVIHTACLLTVTAAQIAEPAYSSGTNHNVLCLAFHMFYIKRIHFHLILFKQYEIKMHYAWFVKSINIYQLFLLKVEDQTGAIKEVRGSLITFFLSRNIYMKIFIFIWL